MKRLLTLCLVVLALTFAPLAQAADTADTAGFSVRALLPDNQLDNGNTYFDIRVQPGQTQELQVEVQNASDSAVVLDIALHTASTNRNGLIEYLIQNEPDETLKHPFSSIAQAQSEITLAPKEAVTVPIRIDMPDEQFDGAMLGGIIFTKRAEGEQTAGIGVNNLFSYVIGVKITETDSVVTPDFDLKSVHSALINYRTAVVAEIRNIKPLIVTGASVAAQVYKGSSTTPLFTATRDNVDFAPNSVFPLPVEWQGERLAAGDYRMAVQLTYGGETWSWDDPFTITASNANDINNGAVQPTTFRFTAWHAATLILFLLVIVAFFVGRKSKQNRSEA